MAAEERGARAGWAYLVGAGPGDPGLLTLRGAELLRTADVVLHDELVAPALLALVGEDTEVRAVGKRGAKPQDKRAKQAAINRELVALAQRGSAVVRLKGGDPFVFGRGAEELAALRQAAVPFEVVPGISAPVGATAYAGIPLTDRDRASSVTFVTAVRRDGSPFDWGSLSGIDGTLCVFMGARNVTGIARGLMIDAGWDPATPAALVENISTPAQRTVSGVLADIGERAADAQIAPPALLIVGAVVAMREELSWFDRQPLFGKRILVTRPREQAGPTLAALQRRGAEPIALPTIAIEAPPDPAAVSAAVRALHRYDWIIFTSQNGVDWFWRALADNGLDSRAFGGARVAVIGPATGRALGHYGIRPDVTAKTFVAESLAEELLAAVQDAQARVLLPRAMVAREVLPETLRAHGLEVDVLPVYQTVAATEASDALRSQLAQIDVVTFTSSSTVEQLVELIGDDAPTRLAHATLASIGPITTKTAERLGLRVAVTATVSTGPGLINALEDHFRDG